MCAVCLKCLPVTIFPGKTCKLIFPIETKLLTFHLQRKNALHILPFSNIWIDWHPSFMESSIVNYVFLHFTLLYFPYNQSWHVSHVHHITSVHISQISSFHNLLQWLEWHVLAGIVLEMSPNCNNLSANLNKKIDSLPLSCPYIRLHPVMNWWWLDGTSKLVSSVSRWHLVFEMTSELPVLSGCCFKFPVCSK